MKDRVFIAWSGSSEIALKVKRALEDKNYKCFIGGNEANDSNFASVGDTVLQQIKSCNQAIVIFQKRSDGHISNNLFFELGYALASYGQTKVHCVRPKNEVLTLPSDFDSKKTVRLVLSIILAVFSLTIFVFAVSAMNADVILSELKTSYDNGAQTVTLTAYVQLIEKVEYINGDSFEREDEYNSIFNQEQINLKE